MVGVHTIKYDSTELVDLSIPLMDSVGAGWVRYDMTWASAEPVDDQWDFAHEKADLQALKAANPALKVLVILGFGADWTWTSCSSFYQANGGCQPDDPAEYGEWVAKAKTEVGQYIDAWEVWNQTHTESVDGMDEVQDTTNHFNGTGDDLLELVKEARTALGPNETLVCCGFTPPDPKHNNGVDHDFVKTFLDAGADTLLDIVSLHAHSEGTQYSTTVESMDSINGDIGSGWEIWNTEFGPTNGGLSGDDISARNHGSIETVFSAMAAPSRSWWTKSFFYTLDVGFDPDDDKDDQHLFARDTASSYVSSYPEDVYRRPYCALAKLTGQDDPIGICTDDLSLTPLTVPPSTVCTFTANGTDTFDESVADFTFNATNGVVVSQSGNSADIESPPSGTFTVQVNVDNYHIENFVVSTDSGAFCAG